MPPRLGGASTRWEGRRQAQVDARHAQGLYRPRAKAVVQELETIKFTSSGLFWDDALRARDARAAARTGAVRREVLDGL